MRSPIGQGLLGAIIQLQPLPTYLPPWADSVQFDRYIVWARVSYPYLPTTVELLGAVRPVLFCMR